MREREHHKRLRGRDGSDKHHNIKEQHEQNRTAPPTWRTAGVQHVVATVMMSATQQLQMRTQPRDPPER